MTYADFTLSTKTPEDATELHDRVVLAGLDVNAHTDTVKGNEYPEIAHCFGELPEGVSRLAFIGRVTKDIDYKQIGR